MNRVSRRHVITSLAALGTSAILPATAPAQTQPGPRLIDVHHHYFPPAFRDALVEYAQRNPGNGVPPFVRTWTPARTLEVLDKGGVSTAILSITTIPGGNWFNGTDADRRRWARLCNDYVAGLARDNPGRFGFFAAMPMPDVEGTLAEIAYAFDTLKADGVGFMTSFGEKWPGDAAFKPVWAELNRRKAIAYFHPASPNCCTALNDDAPPSFLEYPYDTGRAVVSLLFSGTFSNNRDVKWMFSHAGGPIPVLAGRLNSLSSFQTAVMKNLPNGIDYELKRLYYETANSAYKGTMAALLDYVPIGQVMFGTDFPYVSVDENVSGIRKVGLSNAQLAAIAHENAGKLMPRWRA